jgi:hypothetical protein
VHFATHLLGLKLSHWQVEESTGYAALNQSGLIRVEGTSTKKKSNNSRKRKNELCFYSDALFKQFQP